MTSRASIVPLDIPGFYERLFSHPRAQSPPPGFAWHLLAAQTHSRHALLTAARLPLRSALRPYCPCSAVPRTRREAQAPGGTNAPRRSARTGRRDAVAETCVDATHARQMGRVVSTVLGGHVSRGQLINQSHTIHKHCLPRYSGLGPVRGTLRSL